MSVSVDVSAAVDGVVLPAEVHVDVLLVIEALDGAVLSKPLRYSWSP